MEVPVHFTCLLRNLYAGPEETIRTRHGKNGLAQNWERSTSRLYCYPVYLTYIQSTSCEMPGWVSHKLESRMPGEITTISDDTILIAVSGEKLKEPLDEGEKGE